MTMIIAVLIAHRCILATVENASLPPISCNVRSLALVDFENYFDFFTKESSAIIVLTPHDNKDTRQALKTVLGSIAPCGNKIWIAFLSQRLKKRFASVLKGNHAMIWGPRSERDPVVEPHKFLTSNLWLDEIADVVRGLDVPIDHISAANQRQLTEISKIREKRAAYLPRVPPLDVNGTRPIEKRDNLSPDELLSYVLWGVPVIVTDAMADWDCLNWTYGHVMSNYPRLLINNQNILGSGQDDDPNVVEPNAWKNPYFLRESRTNIDKGMIYAGKKNFITQAHNDESCDLSIHATISGSKHWHVYLGDILGEKLTNMLAKGYEGVPFSSKDAPWVGTVQPGEMIIFNQVMMHEVRYEGEAENWDGTNLGVAFYFGHLQPLFFQDAFWDELMEMQEGKYAMCRGIWDRDSTLIDSQGLGGLESNSKGKDYGHPRFGCKKGSVVFAEANGSVSCAVCPAGKVRTRADAIVSIHVSQRRAYH